jgi:hypothetical protein
VVVTTSFIMLRLENEMQVLEKKIEDSDNPGRGYLFKISIAMVFDYVTNSTEVRNMVGYRDTSLQKIVRGS